MNILHMAWAWVSDQWPWIFGSVGVIAIATFAVLNPAAAVKLASSLVGLVLDTARRLVEWLRGPGNKLKALSAVLAVVAAVACWDSYQTNQRYYVVVVERDRVTGERDAARVAASLAKAKIEDLEGALETYKAQEAAYALTQRMRTLALKQAQQESAEAMAMIARQKADAERSNRAWWQAYAKRPDICKAAQEAMDVACATVGEF